MQKHDVIDAGIKKESAKRNLIKKAFLILDLMLVFSLISVQGYLHYARLNGRDTWLVKLCI